MGEIIAFRQPRSRQVAPSRDAGAEILWFTGVRYVRFDAPDETVPPQPNPPRRRKRAIARRSAATVGVSAAGA